MTSKRQRAERRGRRAELVAALLLIAKGYRILARRYRTPLGEIDIVARRRRTVAMVEVKLRRDLEAAAHALGPAQQQRIVRAAAMFAAGRADCAGCDLRFDLMLVVPCGCRVMSSAVGGRPRWAT